MLYVRRGLFLLCIIGGFAQSTFAMIYVNRFFPLFRRKISRTVDEQSNFVPDLMIMTAHRAFTDDEEEKGIPELLGSFDLQKVIQALECLDRPVPILPQIYRDVPLPFILNGKIQTQGFAFNYHQQLHSYFHFYFSWFMMHEFSRQSFTPAPSVVSAAGGNEGDLLQLQRDLLTTLKEVQISSLKTSFFGASDVDMNLRIGNVWDYPSWQLGDRIQLNFRRIDAGCALGAIFPSGVTSNLNNPAVIPFGANGHWGVYLQTDMEFELREDLNIGLFLSLRKLIKQNMISRIPIKDEHPQYAPLIDRLSVDPGYFVVFSPWGRVNDIRPGLGVDILYTLVFNPDPNLTDARTILPANITPTLENFEKHLKFTLEYFTFNLFYDFTKRKLAGKFHPQLMFMFDFPVSFFGGHNFAKTYRASLGIEFKF